MKILKAKIKKSSIHYRKGLSAKGKSVWLTISGFNTHGEHNYKIRTIKGFKNGFAEYQDIWMKGTDLTFKQMENIQLSLDIYSKEEEEENKNNPRYFNQRRFEVTTSNRKYFFHAPDRATAEKVVKDYGISDYKLKQVVRLRNKELD